MINDPFETVKTMRKRYLDEYRHIHKKSDRTAFFKEIGEMAEAANAPAWKKFADGMLACLQDDMETALALLEQAVELDPQFAYPWNAKGTVKAIQKRCDEALEAYEKAIELDPQYAYPWNGKGNVLGEREKYNEALIAFEEAIKRDPKYVAPWNGKGIVLKRLERFDHALAAFNTATELDPEFANPHYGIALLHWRQEKPSESRTAFLHAIELGLGSPWKGIAELWIKRAERMIASEETGKLREEREEEDRSSDEARVTELFEAMWRDLPGIEKKEDRLQESDG